MKKQLQIAKALLAVSLDKDGTVNSQKVHRVLAKIWREKPRGAIGILKAYRRLIQLKLKKEAVLVETAFAIKDKNLKKAILQKTGAKRVIFRTNPDLTIGAKIAHGDWIWDVTLDAKLAQLTTDI